MRLDNKKDIVNKGQDMKDEKWTKTNFVPLFFCTTRENSRLSWHDIKLTLVNRGTTMVPGQPRELIFSSFQALEEDENRNRKLLLFYVCLLSLAFASTTSKQANENGENGKHKK